MPVPKFEELFNPLLVRDYQFRVALYGGRLAIVKAPVPISKRNLERLQRIIGDQLEPFVNDEPAR